MKCSVCISDEHRVIETVERDDEIRRRRKCTRCGHRWTTFEIPEGRFAKADRIVDAFRQLAAAVDVDARET